MILQKPLILSVFFAISVSGQTPFLDTITDVLYNADGTTSSGSMTVQGPNLTIGSTTVMGKTKPVSVSAGRFTTQLVPNDTAYPNGSAYIFKLPNGTTKTCTFPTSSSPLPIAPYCVDGTPVVSPLSPVTAGQIVPGLVSQVICSTGAIANWCTRYGDPGQLWDAITLNWDSIPVPWGSM